MPATTTNLGSLPTSFTPPSDCFDLVGLALPRYDLWWYGVTCTPDWPTVVGATVATHLGSPNPTQITKSSCYPGLIATTLTYETQIVYSPAHKCPQGWTNMAEVTRGTTLDSTLLQTSVAPMWSLMTLGETGYACCPRQVVCSASCPKNI